MKFTSLPPTGNAISLKQSALAEESFFPGLEKYWVSSGTSALAAALSDIKSKLDSPVNPEVIVPAYCCPDLVSAALFEGFVPVLVDVRADSPKYDFGELRKNITSNTAAIIAINFLGIEEDFEAIRSVIADRDICVIEDNAQWFPESTDRFSMNGEYATFSFGRGKALSLLGGGLMVHPNTSASFSQNVVTELPLSQKLKTVVYHGVTNPWVYRWLEAMPFLNIGATEFHALESIGSMPPGRINLVQENYRIYQSRSREVERFYQKTLNQNGMYDSVEHSYNRLLRFPYLCKTKQNRDRLYSLAQKEGLGLSKMYQKPLNEIESVPNLKGASQVYSNAKNFADRFITLPTHEGVRLSHAERICELVLQADAG